MMKAFFREGARRFKTAMVGIPDRVPVYAQMHEFVWHELGADPREFYADPDLLVRGTLAVTADYGIDVPVLDYDVYNIEAEALGQAVIFPPDGTPDVDRNRPLIKTREDLQKIQTPDFEKDGRFPAVIEMNRLFCELTGGSEGTPGFCAPFSLAANIRGIERLLMDMYLDPAFAKGLFARVTDRVLVPWIKKLKTVCPGATGICGSDAFTSLPIVNPDLIKEWIVPYVARLREKAGPEVYVPNWVGESCLKRPEEMLELKLSACPLFIEGQDPDVEKLGPAFYKAYARVKKVPLVLGIGAAFLALATPTDVRQRVKEYVRAAGKGGGFALYLCNLGATTPPGNIRAAVKAIRDYGSY